MKINNNTSARLQNLAIHIKSLLTPEQLYELDKLTADVLRLEFVVDASRKFLKPFVDMADDAGSNMGELEDALTTLDKNRTNR